MNYFMEICSRTQIHVQITNYKVQAELANEGNYLAKDFYYKKRRDAEAQRILPFDRKCSECSEFWPTSQPMAHLKMLVGRFILQVSIKL